MTNMLRRISIVLRRICYYNVTLNLNKFLKFNITNRNNFDWLELRKCQQHIWVDINLL